MDERDFADKAKPYRAGKPAKERENDNRNESSFSEKRERPHSFKGDKGKSYRDRPDNREERPFTESRNKPRTFREDKGKSYRDRPDNREERPFTESKNKPRTFREDKGKSYKERPDNREERPYTEKRERSSFGDDSGKPFKERSKNFKRAEPAFGEKRERPRKSDDDKKGKNKFDKADKGEKRYKDKDADQKQDKPFRERLNKAFDKEKAPKPEREVMEDQVLKELDEVTYTFKDKPPVPFKKKHTTTASGKKKHLQYEDEDDAYDEQEGDGATQDEMPLNKYIAHSGECSRRDAAELVKQGKVKVNGELVTDPGYRVKRDDKVTLSGKKLTPQKGMVYILLNKPKGFITTNEDPKGRHTVMELVANSGVDRLFPVGRLDRETSGLLLITNDGDLTQKLCHPSYNIKKVYHVTLDKALTKADFEKIISGVELEDGKAPVDAIAYLEKKNELGLEIHSGKNRIVRRIFESLGYVVEKLDRVMYAGLTKKNLPRSKWRFLSEREVVLLKHFKS